MAIPTVPGYSQVNTPSSNVKLDFGALNQGNQGARAMAGAVGDVGRMLGDFAQKAQAAVNYGIAADAEREMRVQSQQFKEGLRGRTDEGEWANEWNAKADEFMTDFSSKHRIGPALKRQLAGEFKDWKATNAVEFQTLATVQGINRAKQRGVMAIDEIAKDGGPDAEVRINAELDKMSGLALLLPEEKQRLQVGAMQKKDEYSAANFINNDPIIAEDYLKEKGKDGAYTNLTNLTPEQRELLVSKARGRSTQVRIEYQNDIAARRFAGEVIGDAELEESVAKKLVSASWAKGFRKQQTKDMALSKSTPEQAAEFAEVRGAILAYDPQADGKVEYELLFAAAMQLPEKMASDALALLKNKDKPENALNSPVVKDILQYIDKRFAAGIYGDFEYRYQDMDAKSETYGNWVTKTNPALLEQALAKKSRIEDAVQRYLVTNPNPTREELNGFVSNFQINETVGTGRGVLLQSFAASPDDEESKQARLEQLLAMPLGDGKGK